MLPFPGHFNLYVACSEIRNDRSWKDSMHAAHESLHFVAGQGQTLQAERRCWNLAQKPL